MIINKIIYDMLNFLLKLLDQIPVLPELFLLLSVLFLLGYGICKKKKKV